MDTREGRLARINDLNTKLKFREGIGIHKENCEAIRDEIARLENIEQLIAMGIEDDDGTLVLTPDMEEHSASAIR